MYNKVAGAGSLPVLGYGIASHVVLAATLMAAGLALVSLAPKVRLFRRNK